ncbi:MAG TPA: hypothetical protein VN616_08370 [Puia sp.]|nr:hypothetical protein [Puia sp.]
MEGLQKEIMQQLQQEILLRQGFRPPTPAEIDVGLGLVANAFPQRIFPTGAIHELVSDGDGSAAASAAFVATLTGRLMVRGGACIWIGRDRAIFPPGLAAFGVDADKVIFIRARRDKELLWIMEEALKSEGLSAVVGEIRDVGLIASRRLQLAVEQSRVTGFLLRDSPRNRNPIATVARWRITPAASEIGELPGVGHCRWNVELLRVRNGQPGNWILEWQAGHFRMVFPAIQTMRPGWARQTG